MHTRYSSLAAFALGALLLLFAACSSDPQRQGPRETAEAFLTALQFNDYDKAKTYCSEESAKNLDFMKTMSSLGGSPFKQFTIKDVKEEGDYATVTYDDDKEEGKILQLRKDDKKWVVIMSKTDMGSKDSDDDAQGALDTGSDASTDSEEDKTPPADKYKEFRDGKSANEVATTFLKALDFGDYDAAMRYGSSSTNDMLDYQKSMAALGTEKSQPKRTILRVEEDGDFAQAFYKEEGKKGEKILKMGKDDHGNWEVIMTKAEMQDE